MSVNDIVREIQRNNSPNTENELAMDNTGAPEDTGDPEVVNELVVERRPKQMEAKFEMSQSIPPYRRNLEVISDIEEIDDLESIPSGSKLTLNDAKSDSEDVIQELNKLNLDLEENDKYSSNYRKRGQSWSNWDNDVIVDLKTEVCVLLVPLESNH